jgi:hypothetical protein
MPDTGACSPDSNGDDYSDWNNASNAYSSDDSYAEPSALDDQHDFYGFDLSAASGTIDGIQVDIEYHGHNNSDAIIEVELSYDGGGNYTSSGKSCTINTTSDTTETLGGAADTWGRSWSTSELTAASFRVRICTPTGSVKTYVDHITTTVTYTPAAGGAVTQMMNLKRRRV